MCAPSTVPFAFYAAQEPDYGSEEEDPAPPRGLFYVYTGLMLAAAALTTCVQGSATGTADEEHSTSSARPSWRDEAWHTLKMGLDPRMVRLSPIFFYSGFNQPYQLDTFGNRFFTSKLLGLELFAFYVLEAVGGAVVRACSEMLG